MKVFNLTNIFNHPFQEGFLLKQSVAVVGTFDGPHKGHLKLWAKARTIAKQKKLKLSAVTFEYKPNYFLKREKPKVIYCSNDKELIFACFNFTYFFNFIPNQKNLSLSPDQFLCFLQDVLKVKYVVVGSDFLFGKNRVGNAKSIKQKMPNQSLIIKVRNRKKWASSTIRSLLKCHNIKQVNNILMHPVFCTGQVTHGKQLGRTLKFPTANLHLSQKLSLPFGVYAVFIKIKQQWYYGSAFYWQRENNYLLETHVFNFHEMIYQAKIMVVFVAFVRKMAYVKNLKELIPLIDQDNIISQKILQKSKSLVKKLPLNLI